MSYRERLRRVEIAERVFELRVAQTGAHWDDLKRNTRDAMTPTRILVGGALSGYLLGRFAPEHPLRGGARMMKFAGSFFTLIGSLQAGLAAAQATAASHQASAAAAASATASDTAVDAVEQVAS